MELLDLADKEKLSFTSVGKKVNLDNDFMVAVERLGLACGVN